MLISLSELLETPVSTLLGENVTESKIDEVKVLSEKLEVINHQLAQRKKARRKAIHWFLILLCLALVIVPETAVIGVAIHALEWIFIRVAPIAFIVVIIGIVLTRNR